MNRRGIGIVGAGGWGTALALLLGRETGRSTLWVREPAKADALSRSRVNETYLPGHALPESVEVTADLARVAQPPPSDPGSPIPGLAKRLDGPRTPSHSRRTRVVNAAKGIEVSTTLRALRSVVGGPFGPEARAVRGASPAPTTPKKSPPGLPTTSVVAASEPSTAAEWQDLLMTPMFRVYTSDDVIGVELGGALKNVIALAAGIADGLGYGDNTKAAIITRGLAEMSRLGVAMGARAITFSGLSGVGDLIATCQSAHSRNASAGRRIGQGAAVADVLGSTPKVIEGVPTCRAALALAERFGVEMPITHAVGDVLFGGKKPKEAVGELMGRGPKSELEALYP